MRNQRIWGSLFWLGLAVRAIGASTGMVDLDWPKFLARHDMVWSKLPTQWWEAPFLGNGTMGTMLKQSSPRTLEWLVGRGDVEDRRDTFMGHARLPIGNFLLNMSGEITGCDLHLTLWDAELRGSFTTTQGAVTITAWVQADAPVIVLQVAATGNEDPRWEWRPGEAVSPRYTIHAAGSKTGALPEYLRSYRKNPPSRRETVRGFPVEIQPLAQGGYATAWALDHRERTTVLFVSTAYEWSDASAAKLVDAAVVTVEQARETSREAMIERHRRWWNEFYPRSFVSIPDSYWESFYWIQLYKIASATRADGALADLCGPWLQPTPWPATWWNLNAQLTYWLPLSSNHLDLADSLRRVLRENRANLIRAVPPEYRDDSAAIPRATGQDLRGPIQADPETVAGPGAGVEVGNLTWICHNLWLHYRMSMDDVMLRDEVYPLLRRAVNYYLHFLTECEDGRLHLPSTSSPEYKAGPDCNYDLALLRWGCRTLLQATDRLRIDDPLRSRWREVLDRLVDYPRDEAGFMIARGVRLTDSHRHFSHLLMAYPLYLKNIEQPGDPEIIAQSLKHWHSFPGALQGYSFTGGASISAALGRGNDALRYLEGLKRFIQPNTLYREAGPVIETPLAAAQSIHDMLLQSWPGSSGSVIRVFPAVPDAWSDVVFDRWRAEGAFLVSASRQNGVTAWVRIKSLAGERCLIRPNLVGAAQISGSKDASLISLGGGLYELVLGQGEEATLYTGDQPPTLKLPAIPPGGQVHHFGLQAENSL